MSELRSAVRALRGEALAEVPDGRLREDFAELRSVAELLQLEALRRLAEIERRGLHERDGHLSAVAWLSALQADLEAAWSRPRVASLGLPRVEGVRLVVGRSPDCDCVVPEDCASRRHSEIWREGGRWFLRDLGSRNGTRLNGMRVAGRVEIRVGDRVSLGGATYRLGSRA